jgi:hypothetical protein
LCSFDILDPSKAVVVAAIANAGLIHLPRQPFPPVHIQVKRKGKPGLQAGTHKAKHRMDEVVV